MANPQYPDGARRLVQSHRLNLGDMAVMAGRPRSESVDGDPVVDALETLRHRLADEGGTLVMDRQAHRVEIHGMAERVFLELSLTENERARALAIADQDLFGWGVLEQYMTDPGVTEILVDGWDHCDVERNGQLETVPVKWHNHAELLAYIKRLIEPANRPLDEGNPIVDVEIQGHRINATCPPVSTSCTLNIRKATSQTKRFSPVEFVEAGACDFATMRLLLALARAGATTLVCGPMGSGKTTLARILIERGAPPETRWIVLEDTRETAAAVDRFVSLQTVQRRTNSVEMPDLFKATKRKRPDRVAVGEVRSHLEAEPMLQSVMMGHPGSITTTHAGTPKQAIANFVFYLKQGGMDVKEDFLREVLHESLDCLAFVHRFRDGSRRVTRVVEIVPMGDPDFPDGFRELIHWDFATNTWQWVNPISPALAERFAIESVRLPAQEDRVTAEDLTPARLDLATAAWMQTEATV